MRLYNFKLLNEMSDSLKEGVKYTVETGSSAVLKTCVELLSAIQTNLEINRESLKSEKIFDIIFGLSKEIINFMSNSDNESENIINLSNELSDALSNDINYKLKILFVAELGGKWDSMASVYEEFIKREDCDVDVVIQPIFREVRYNTGEVRKETILEDYLTPMGIRNIPYDQYDMEKIKPDITFFSQPYETCTVSMFWPENMSKYTRVVYLPYYFTKSISKRGAAYESFFRMNTEKYSWRIVCQSEIMKTYYKHFTSRKGENVIVTGIPKFDYPFKLNKTNTPCPKEWKKKIEGKKVFLLNTHFTKITDGKTPFSNFIGIIEIFINKHDVALIWRPHPMTDVVVKLYNPQLYPIYLQLINKIEMSKNIVIDKSTPYDEAFVWSDAMISHGSSLQVQYILMNKPCATIDMAATKDTMVSKYYRPDKLWDYYCETFLTTIEEIRDFVNSVCDGNYIGKDNQYYLRKTFLSMADGNVGKRVVEKVLSDFRKECGLSSEIKNVTCNERILVVGSEKDSMPCINQLKELNIKYCVCNDYIDNEPYNEDVPLCSVDELCDSSFDYVIITDKGNENIINVLLTNIYGIPQNKIVRFWKMYNASLPIMHCDRVMMNPKNKKYDGLILGISHTEVGIIADDLKKSFVNLALSSQDLYYQLKILEYCLYKYPDKFSELNYAIIDLYDYKYLNFDTSKSKSALKYLSFGGYNLDPHNFADNKNFNCTYEEAVNYFISQKYAGLTDTDINIWNRYFKDVYKYADYQGFEPNYDIRKRIRIVTDADINEYVKPLGNLGANLFSQTIDENTHNLDLIFKRLLSLNKNIKIYTVIIPKFINTEVEIEEGISKFISSFMKNIDELHKKYDFTMLDFNKISDISSKREFYFDAAHLNYFGAKWLTNKLNELIFGDGSE